jgi:hypothetical protein
MRSALLEFLSGAEYSLTNIKYIINLINYILINYILYAKLKIQIELLRNKEKFTW